MRPFTPLRRAPALAGAALLPIVAASAVASAGTEPSPPAETTSTSSVGDIEIPGGIEPDILQEGTWFDDDGRLYLPENTDQPSDKDAAFCSFVFGSPDEVAEALGLDEELTFAESSGLVYYGGGGSGYSCGYVPLDSDLAMVIATEDSGPDGTDAVGADDTSAGDTADDDTTTGDTATGDTTDEEQSDRPLVVFALLSEPLEIDGVPEGYAQMFQLEGADGEYSGALGLSTEYDGDPVDDAFAQAWLTTARDRLA